MSRRLRALLIFLWCCSVSHALAKPSLFIIGDSTVRNSTAGQVGWGDPLMGHFDPAKIQVYNRAIGGRSSRTFLSEGRWDAVMAHLKPGDFVLMQFGHNDGGPLNDERCRASIKGNGDETEEIVRKTDQVPETVRSYGWYLRNYIKDAKSRGATPIVVSLIPRNLWKDGKVGRADTSYGLWAKQAAEQESAAFIDFNQILAERYEALGRENVASLFAGTDHTHTSRKGADFHAEVLAKSIRALSECQLGKALFPEDLWMPSIYSDHMVLQREMALPVRGRAIPGVEVIVKLAKSEVKVTTAADGTWQLELPKMKAGGPHVLEVSAGEVQLRYQDVWVGEVWFASGQSNMDFTLAKTQKRSFSGVTDWEKVVAEAQHPQLRMFTAEWAMHEFPQRDVLGKWAVCSPSSAGDFSAVAYHFGVALQKELKLPIGLITCAYGASTIEAWMRQECLQAHPQFKELLHEFGKKQLVFRDNPNLFLEYGKALAKFTGGRAPRNPDPVQDQHNPFVLHNGMIAPIAPFAIRGAIWYQGESNLNSRSLYADLQNALIADWRQIWNRPDLPFYFVQLAGYQAATDEPSSGQLPEMREAQAKSLLLPNTGMAVTIDIGDEKDIHPRNKRDVGERLARLALAKTYQQRGVATGPVLRDVKVESGQIRLSFDSVGRGLHAKGGRLQHFAIAGADLKFVWADAVIVRDSVLVSSPQISAPAYVRYAWGNHPRAANLYNSEALPAAPFRTDP